MQKFQQSYNLTSHLRQRYQSYHQPSLQGPSYLQLLQPELQFQVTVLLDISYALSLYHQRYLKSHQDVHQSNNYEIQLPLMYMVIKNKYQASPQ